MRIQPSSEEPELGENQASKEEKETEIVLRFTE